MAENTSNVEKDTDENKNKTSHEEMLLNLKKLRDEIEKTNELEKSVLFSILDKAVAPMAIVTLLFSSTLVFIDTNNYIDKEQTKNKISTLIFNNAEIETIKYAFDNQTTHIKSSFFNIFEDKSNQYPSNIPLSRVLMDLKTDQYISAKPDKDKIEKINSIIVINEKQNPFSGLDNSQKDMFKNILVKSGEKYDLIQPEINKIADQLMESNIKLSENSSENKISYYVSITSFISALAIAAFQIFQSRPRKIKEIFINALQENDIKSKNDK